MSDALKVFVSSVQKELEDERLIVANLISTDPFLAKHSKPVLYEIEPASPAKAVEGCLGCLDECQVYALIVDTGYGSLVDDLSITHMEYRRAKEMGLPVLAFIKGDRRKKREAGTEALLAELDHDGFKYKRFNNIIQLQTEVRRALVKLFKDDFGISPSSDENKIAKQTIEATSPFESQAMDRMQWGDLDQELAQRLITSSSKTAWDNSQEGLLAAARMRGLVWRDKDSGEHFATAAGILLLARDPALVFPQSRMLADAYSGAEPDGSPRDHQDITGPLPEVVDRAIAFIERNTRHPMRVVGLNRVRLDEYPVEGLREALVNAVAHRLYEDAGRKILLEVFSDRVVVSSPGLPPSPITLPGLRSGKYKPCSRNPLLAQCMSYFHRIEERGSGFRRMREQMLNHGLDIPLLGTETGYFQVTFPGPGDDVERLKTPDTQLLITPAVEAELNERQRAMAAMLAQGEELTSRRCQEEFQVTRDTAARDFGKLIKLGVAVKQGKGRSTRYVLATRT